MLKVNYFRTELRIRNADQTPSLDDLVICERKRFPGILGWLVKRASNDNKNENPCQLRRVASSAC